MTLNEIIERKKDELEKVLECSCTPDKDLLNNACCERHGITAINNSRFLEKAIRESVEEALREIGYSEKVERECGCWGNGRTSDYHLEKDCPGKLREYTRFDSKVKEFMK